MYKKLLGTQHLQGLPETIEEYLEGPGEATCMVFNPFGTILATGCRGGGVVLWSYEIRSAVRTFSGVHGKEVKVLLWSRDGRLLLSAGLDGSIAVWDVLQGKPCLSKKLPWGISHVACAPPHAPGDLTVQPVLVSFVGAPARLLPSLQALPEPDASRKDTMAALEETGKLLPAIALAGEGRKAKLLSGKAAGAEGHLAVPTPCGKCIVSAGRGMLCLLRRKDFAILDALKLDGIPSVTRLEFDASGRQLLVGTTGRHVRVFSVTVPDDGTTSFTTEELIKALPLRSKKEESLVRGGGQEAALLRLTRRFTAQIERLDWGPCCFSPDGEHVVSALRSPNEHVMYTWNVAHGYPENTLQGGKDGVVALTWHPEQTPMQLLALGESGKIYIWTKILTQKWSAFAPDFETLEDNREHIESETEFDMEPTSSDAHGADRGEDEAVDVVGWEWLDGNGSGATAQGAAAPRGDGSQAPGADLMHLPLVLPDIKLTAKDEYVVMCAEVAGAGEAAELGEAGKAAADEEMHVAAAGKGPPNVGEMEEGAEGAVKKPRTE